MSKSIKTQSSDKLIEQAINIIDELFTRGINFFQATVDTYNDMKKKVRTAKEKISKKGT